MVWHQFGPHVGAAYQITPKLVARGSYGLFYVPFDGFGSGGGDQYPANQNPLSVGTNMVGTSVAGGTAFNWDSGYPEQWAYMPPQNSTATSFGDMTTPAYIMPGALKLGRTQTLYVGVQYEPARNVLLDVRYQGNWGGGLHDYGHSIDQSWPTWGQYEQLLASGNVTTQINNPSDAAALGVPYPYPGFSGPAFAAIAPYPQVASQSNSSLRYAVESVGDPAYSAVSAFRAFIAELKVRNSHGLYVDWSYTVSKQTSSYPMTNFSNEWGSLFQSPWTTSMQVDGLNRGINGS